MYNTILVPTDGSPVAEDVGTYAIGLAERFDAAIHVVSVLEGGLVASGDEDEGERAVEELADRARDRGLDVTTELREQADAVHEEILAAADERDADLIAMGTTGRSGVGRFLLGSVAEQTLRESSVPVATVHEETALEGAFERVLVPTDGSHSSEAALEHAIDLAAETGARLHIVHVSDEEAVEEMETFDVADTTAASDDDEIGLEPVDDALEYLRGTQLDVVDISIPSGRVDQQILATAATSDADCIVMGTHGETGLRRYLLGSTTERVVRFTGVPVIGISATRAEAVTVEYLDYQVVDERGWSLEDEDLLERAAEGDLDDEAHGTFEVGRDEYVLDAAEAAGHSWPFHCRAGGCVNCTAVLLEGELEMDVQRSLSEEEVEEKGFRLTCVATPASDSIELVYGAKHLDELRDRVV
ncbi:ferredoxin (2Fe-2S) / UspA domain protein (plasmid) [Natrialba magadii ATCC 43099]|uniref:Ferredoxin (2Fe-2S) / UspA domain protein n=1 Tax=Natrialba magadii (strain ATCC 43099 / DSM 3394 / CCM 3739 / CIP 104546 / IAM 13178 / JCM 8861 / NBRC 102185 / NCIMB 2190 / MS3) TaxID=547559 RepID=D3T199_NATMM|nr:ferredoxin Fer [Natrialba magadii]ADD07358.1 ferredoxin (2Fe-2S) / UspA domain protein [Natrialba magadii ATCC 43099]ELY32613.1 UspA domain-containing protein [Natrialba magadii ATCC 43099]